MCEACVNGVEIQDTLAMHPEIEELFKFKPAHPTQMPIAEKTILDNYLMMKDKYGHAWEHACPNDIRMAANMIMIKYGINL